MASGVQNRDADAPALRRRLKVVAESHSQSELARRTGVSKANVHRYLRAGRIPVDFIQRLALEFGISPAWLILGRGEMLESRASEQVVEESNRLLELVVKLNAVGHERMGSLEASDSARMVRELADALTRHEDLQKQLLERIRPVYLKLLEQYRVMIGEHRHEETGEVLPALRQLVRLAQNPSMQANVDMIEAVQRFFEGDLTKQRDLQRGALGMLISAGRLRDAQFMRLTYNTCVGLASSGRLSESARLGNAVLHLSNGGEPKWLEDWLLRVPQAILDMQEGRLGRATQELSSVITACGGEIASSLKDALVFTGFLAGMTPFEDMVKRWSTYAVGSPPLLLAAIWSRDPDSLRRVRRSRINMQGHLDARSRRLLEMIDTMMETKDPPPVESNEPSHSFELLVASCEARLRAGQKRKAAAAFKQVEEAHASLDAEFLPDFLVRATHARARLELGDGAKKQQAAEFFRTSLLQGYGVIAPLAAEHGIKVSTPGSAMPR
ncbi:MAG: helix-turn-helix domain-containing protein [Planctomycetes bacterium]|nr:helix-turn-helix domain-containing protein [Planctomycetota bacterium]